MADVEITDEVHTGVVVTLCSCYPWPVLGLPPTWYKAPPYRARMVREPRTLLRELGVDLPDAVEIRVWDSSAEVRYMVLPQRPAGTDGLSEAPLTGLVTRAALGSTASSCSRVKRPVRGVGRCPVTRARRASAQATTAIIPHQMARTAR